MSDLAISQPATSESAAAPAAPAISGATNRERYAALTEIRVRDPEAIRRAADARAGVERGKARLYSRTGKDWTAAFQRVANDPAHLLLLDEEPVVAEVGDDVRALRDRQACVQLVREARRVEAVGVDRHDGAVGADAAQGNRHAAPVPTHVVGVHRLGQDEIGVRVETSRQLAGVVVEVGLDGEATSVTRAQRVLAELGGATEALVELGLRAVGDVGDTTRETQARVRAAVARVVVAAREVGIVPDGQQLRLAPGDLVGRGAGRRREDDAAVDVVRVRDRPLDGSHAAHRAAHDGSDPADAEVVEELTLGCDLVADGDVGEPTPPGPSVRCLSRRAGAALAAAQDVGCDDEPLVGVDGAALSDQGVPPPW